jgi:hypothetical protein
MATFYATGTGTWDATNLAIWFMDAARTIPATAVPTAVDDVITDGSTGTITIGAGSGLSAVAKCRNITIACNVFPVGATNSSRTLLVYGDMTIDNSGKDYGTSTAVYTYFANATSATITNNASVLPIIIAPYTNVTLSGGNVSVVGVTGGAYFFNISSNVTITATCNFGTTKLQGTGNLTVTSSYFAISTGQYFNGQVKYYPNAGTSISVLSVTGGGYSDLVIDTSLVTQNLAPIASTFAVTSGNATIKSKLEITGNCTFTNLTLSGTLTNRTLLTSSVEFTRRTLTVNGTLSVSNAILRNITGAGSASWDLSGATDVGHGGYNSGITFPASRDTYWVGVAGGNWNDANNWSLTSNGTSGVVPLPQDIHKFDANSITSGGRSITVGHYLLCGEIQSDGLLNTPTLVTTALNVIFLKSIDLSGFGTLTSNKICYTYNESDVTIKGSGSQTIYDLRTYQSINSELKVSFKSNFNVTTLFGRNVIDCESNTITVSTYYNIIGTATLNIDSGGKLVITTAGRWALYKLTQTGDGCVELGGSGSPYIDIHTDTGTRTFTINNLCINCTGTADIKRSNALLNSTTYTINKLTFAQANKALTFYSEGGTNGNVRLILGDVVTAGGNSLTASNGQGLVSITTANRDKSKVLDFGDAALTNIAAQEKNTVYTTGTVTNCTGVINRIPRLIGKVFFGTLARTKIGGFFNSIDFNNHEI